MDANLPALPEGDAGIAAKHPGDIGIETDPAVIFHEDFEDCRTAADLHRKWSKWSTRPTCASRRSPPTSTAGNGPWKSPCRSSGAPCSVGARQIARQGARRAVPALLRQAPGGVRCPANSIHNGGTISAGYWRGESAGPGKRSDGRNKFLANYETDRRLPGQLPSPGPLNIYVYHPEQRGRFGDHFYPSGLVTPNTSLPFDFGPHFVRRPDFVPDSAAGTATNSC